MYIASGAMVNTGNLTNSSSGLTDGTIDLNGHLIVRGNWLNNTNTGNAFVNIEPIPNGLVLLLSTISQTIGGTTPTHFENLTTSITSKQLISNNNVVKGILTIESVLDLNKNRIIIDNANANAITYNSGYILSETNSTDGLGEIQWNIGNSLNSYRVPFGSGIANNNLDLTLTTLTAAEPLTGSIIFATYPTSASNTPLPTGISTIDPLKVDEVVDRFWKIESTHDTKPNVDILFTYTSNDIEAMNNPGITESDLQAVRFNSTSLDWKDWGPTGIAYPTSRTVEVKNVDKKDLFPWWTLISESIIPNAFTPDGDGVNDIFARGFNVRVINRWGQELYNGKEGWDGNFNGKEVSPGTYYYILTKTDANNNITELKGPLTLIR